MITCFIIIMCTHALGMVIHIHARTCHAGCAAFLCGGGIIALCGCARMHEVASGARVA